jgi:hypothetical protein
MASAMSKRHCPHTGVSLPECCCRHCCLGLLRRYAPQLLTARTKGAVTLIGDRHGC